MTMRVQNGISTLIRQQVGPHARRSDIAAAMATAGMVRHARRAVDEEEFVDQVAEAWAERVRGEGSAA
jgi:hypothetical protein